MAYCSLDRVKRQTASVLDDTTLTSLLDDAEDEIRAELETNGLPLTPSPVPYSLQQAAFNWTCRNVYRLLKTNGTLPNMLVLGSKTEQVTIDSTIADHDTKGRQLLDQYIDSQSDMDESGLLTLTGDD